MVRNFSVRWTGVIVPPQTGNYLIGFTGKDGYRLWLDGKVLVEDWTRHRPATTETKGSTPGAGPAYPVKIEYFQLMGGRKRSRSNCQTGDLASSMQLVRAASSPERSRCG